MKGEMRVMKKTLMRKFSFLLAFAILVTTILTGNGVAIALAEENSQGNSVHVKLQKSITESLEQGNKHFVHVTAQNSSQEEATLNIYLKKGDDSPALDVKATNLYSLEEDITDRSTQKTIAETLQSAVTLQDNTTAALEAAWMTEVDENGNTTARYLEAKLPAGAQTTFDMELLYATEDKSYDRTVKVEAKAFVDESEVTEAADTEDGGKENQVSVQWKNVEEKQTSAQETSAKANAEEAAITTFADSSAYTAAQIQAILDFLEKHPQYTLLDTTEMNKNGDWTTASVLYRWNLEETDGFIASWKPTELSGTNIVAWDLTGLTSGDMIFSYSNNWDTANANDYYKTGSKSITELQGNIFQYSGVDQSTSGDDNGKWFYTLEKVVLERSPLSGRDVYLDTTNISGMTTPPILRISNGDGTTTDIKMEQCYNQETVFHYQFNSYVLPGTSFQFVNSDGAVTVPDSAVSNIDTTKPCYDGTTWKAYVPEASTVRISVNHDFKDKGGAQVVFTKDGTATGKTIDLGTTGTGSFDFDMADETYDGFYIKQKEDSQEGNTTVIKVENDIREAVNMYGTPLTASVGGWNGGRIRTLTFAKYTSLADSSLNIPKATTAFKKDPELYYVNSTFYDYYSDEELKGNNRKNLSGNFNHTSGSSDKVQAQTFNRAVSEYFKGTSLMDSGSSNTVSATYQSPLYFGELTGADSINRSLNNFVWFNNNGEPNRVNGAPGARQGLVNDTLVNNQLVMGTENKVSPYFSEAFLRGSNSTGSEVGKVFNDIQFPFVKNKDGYWEFDSYNSAQTVRMKEDINGKYFLDRVGADNAVHGMTMYDGQNVVATYQSNFFPFNDVSESCKSDVNNAKRLNYGFGVRLDIPFYMTSDGKVTMSKSDGKSESKDIVFNFSGDDDVWVFIDGKLILDIGGDHGAVAGEINFATHTATTTTNTKETVNEKMWFFRIV